MSSSTPKQYLRLAGRTVIEWSLAPFLARDDIAGIVVALAADDRRFATLTALRDPRITTVVGGNERAESVRNALLVLGAEDRDFVLVHDAARPCLHADDLELLFNDLRHDDVGGLLATPVSDTLKGGDSSRRVTHTQSRANLWRALTPQMFRFDLLKRALNDANVSTLTDDAAAIEAIGLKPRLVQGRSDNIKITVPEDLRYAEFILSERAKQRGHA